MDKPNDSQPDRFVIGSVSGFHGLQGALKVRSDMNNPSVLLNIKTVELEPYKAPKIVSAVTSIKIDRSGLVMVLDDFSDRTSAEYLLGATIYVDRAQINELEDEEWWVRDLVGLDAYTTDGVHVGTIYDIISGSNQLIEILRLNGDKNNTILVPFVKALVPVVDIKARRVEIVNLPGLLD